MEKENMRAKYLAFNCEKLPIKNALWPNTGGEVSQKKFQQRRMFVPNNMYIDD